MNKFISLSLISILTSYSSAHAFTLVMGTLSNGSSIANKGWQRSTITYDYDFSACPASVSSATLQSAFQTAFAMWNSVPTAQLNLQLGVSVSTNYASAIAAGNAGLERNPVIFCDTNFSTDLSVSANVVTGVGTAYFTSTGKTYFGFIALNAQTGGTSSISAISSNLLTLVMAHETGHTLGLGHSQDANALMYYNASGKTGSITLSQDDLAGISYLYPRDEFGGQAFGCGTLNRGDSRGNFQRFPGLEIVSLMCLLFLGLKWQRTSLRQP